MDCEIQVGTLEVTWLLIIMKSMRAKKEIHIPTNDETVRYDLYFSCEKSASKYVWAQIWSLSEIDDATKNISLDGKYPPVWLMASREGRSGRNEQINQKSVALAGANSQILCLFVCRWLNFLSEWLFGVRCVRIWSALLFVSFEWKQQCDGTAEGGARIICMVH